MSEVEGRDIDQDIDQFLAQPSEAEETPQTAITLIERDGVYTIDVRGKVLKQYPGELEPIAHQIRNIADLLKIEKPKYFETLVDEICRFNLQRDDFMVNIEHVFINSDGTTEQSDYDLVNTGILESLYEMFKNIYTETPLNIIIPECRFQDAYFLGYSIEDNINNYLGTPLELEDRIDTTVPEMEPLEPDITESVPAPEVEEPKEEIVVTEEKIEEEVVVEEKMETGIPENPTAAELKNPMAELADTYITKVTVDDDFLKAPAPVYYVEETKEEENTPNTNKGEIKMMEEIKTKVVPTGTIVGMSILVTKEDIMSFVRGKMMDSVTVKFIDDSQLLTNVVNQAAALAKDHKDVVTNLLQKFSANGTVNYVVAVEDIKSKYTGAADAILDPSSIVTGSTSVIQTEKFLKKLNGLIPTPNGKPETVVVYDDHKIAGYLDLVKVLTGIAKTQVPNIVFGDGNDQHKIVLDKVGNDGTIRLNVVINKYI